MELYIEAMATTTIQVSSDLLNKLKSMKMFNDESYEDVIWGLIEDTMEVNEQTKRDMAQSRKEIKEGKTIPFEEVKRQLKMMRNVRH